MDKREFDNNFPDFDGRNVLHSDGRIERGLCKKLRAEISRQLHALQQGFETERDESNYSVYTGVTGIGLLYFHLYQVFEDDNYLQSAMELIKSPLKHLKGHKLTFLCGDAGPLAVGAVIFDRVGKQSHSQDCLKRLHHLVHLVCDDQSLADELLTGRAGFLFALLFVHKHLGPGAIESSAIQQVFKSIVKSGENMSKTERSQSPLMFEWHEKQYLGAAHGLAGIFCTLMQAGEVDSSLKPCVSHLVKPSVDYMMTLKLPSGNYPSSLGSSSTKDKLVHWCHGAPGWIYMFILAYKTFGEQKYLDAAKCCAEVIWERGLLQKGYGICHGVAGNAYGFLAMFRLTKDQKYLYRAFKFAEWCFDYGKHGCRTPDRPYSLFEGLAGTIYFLADLLDPKNSLFPAFEL